MNYLRTNCNAVVLSELAVVYQQERCKRVPFFIECEELSIAVHPSLAPIMVMRQNTTRTTSIVILILMVGRLVVPAVRLAMM